MKAFYQQVNMPGDRGNAFRRSTGKKVLLHAFCWTVFIIYELGSARYSLGRLEPFYVYIVFYSLNITYFYTCYFVLQSVFGQNKRPYYRALIYWLPAIAVYLLLKRVADFLFYNSGDAKTLLSPMKALGPVYLFRTVYYTILAIFYWSAGHIVEFKKLAIDAERRELVTARNKAELQNAYLQQQISPHLLFNTLNFIYGMVHQSSPEAARSVLLLSDITRFGLQATGADGKVSLSEELFHINQLIEINSHRFNYPLCLELVLEGNFDPYRLIPLILLTLTENIFKHGNLKDPSGENSILIRVSPDGQLTYRSDNLKKNKSALQKKSGLGLHNLRLRLDFAYSGRYNLEINESETRYETKLTIKL